MRIFVNGTFDVLHAGHVRLLNFAKQLGLTLTVAIDSDERVAALKGNNRPICPLDARLLVLRNLRAVDSVTVFDTDAQLENLVSAHDIMVKGSDYIGKPIVGEHLCQAIVFFRRDNDEFSSTAIINSFNR